MSVQPHYSALTSRLHHRPAIQAHSLESLVGNTPLLAIRSLTRGLPHLHIYGKAEWANPGGSVKDRAALSIIQGAEARGDLRPGVTLIDSTSGNTGIAYAMLGRARGIPVRLVVPANASPERLAILRAYGAELVLSDPAEGSDGAIRVVRQMIEEEPGRYFYANQYNNPDNWQAHYRTTAPEIWQQTAGQITHFIAGMGTSGTMMGTGRRLKELNPAIRLVAVMPDSPFNGLEGLKHMATAIRPGIYDESIHDELAEISTEETYAMLRRIAREEGLLLGISSGAALVAAEALAHRLADQGQAGHIVAMLPDNASKYLSDPLWTAEG